ncbi:MULTISPECIES: TetR/AcrR family transcriptional regulator [Micromonospora]|uniref:TetR/AcrR family transcriptional regulator n=1 Tax=Micromonospora solifontis TaxID=2487138 RepID=A0ABX9WQ97_9ACTN|nr:MULTISPECIES: TetR/AcrR family transcriptional regulator [Micromonospora]NES14329.1 TetR/AcrR family transcriptional regulator [Micromonospora sp. PPF5-17B]NES35063.1 TetR/AcrR family transcriptional regulator [Micromonospora solifontis]NES57756.1 TetR/AcrR family transcriptional regulator [Micromonospora sp. PPF5-6]RNM01333.1 TetR/AcrR family transcriptional regulator [Micromonospora solifontis]
MVAPSLRARVRAGMIDEIKAVARRHLATDGANLSLRAVARDMGMVSSAIYRYFPSRDDLLTALILEAYDALGDAVEAADAGVDRADLRGRWHATCRAARTWALAHPAEYALLYGSPVPGYAAPEDTVAPASRPPLTLVGIIRDGFAGGRLDPPGAEPPEPVRSDVAELSALLAVDLPPSLLARGMAGWTQLFGLISFELFGRTNGMLPHRDEYFDHQTGLMADLIGLPAA